MSPTKTTPEEPKGTLSPGDPEASYLAPDLSFQDGTGEHPDIEKEWHEGRDEARDEAAQAAADAENAVVKRRADEAEKAQKEAEKASATAAPAPKAAASSSSSS